MIETLLTAYDPSDLPGTSIDPLGFERGYLFLADKILPGLTNVASRPRYFALLCAGLCLSGEAAAGTPREVTEHRLNTLLRLERFWALANVLARPGESGGVRGVRYAQAFRDELVRQSASRTSANYRLLSRQTQYGAVGMYANVADGMRFLNREDFTLTADLGEVAAEAFLEETALPGSLRRAVLEDDADVGLSSLTDWGHRAHVDAVVKAREAKCLLEALHSNPVRSSLAALLDLHGWKGKGDTELARLGRIAAWLKKTGQHPGLREAMSCILEFEGCYQLVALSLERLIWLCRHHSAASVTLAELNGDFVLQLVRDRLPAQCERFLDSLDNGTEPTFLRGLETLVDVRRFLEKTCAAVGDVDPFVDALLTRHTDVQHGKFDNGRRKMPWLERNNSCISLTMTRAGGFNFEATLPEHIAPHPYRVRAADALIYAASKAAQS